MQYVGCRCYWISTIKQFQTVLSLDPKYPLTHYFIGVAAIGMKSRAQIYAVATGTGSCIPPVVMKNIDYAGTTFYNEDGSRIETPGEEIVAKFEQITDIRERRCAAPNQVTSDLATEAGSRALDAAGFDGEIDGNAAAVPAEYGRNFLMRLLTGEGHELAEARRRCHQRCERQAQRLKGRILPQGFAGSAPARNLPLPIDKELGGRLGISLHVDFLCQAHVLCRSFYLDEYSNSAVRFRRTIEVLTEPCGFAHISRSTYSRGWR